MSMQDTITQDGNDIEDAEKAAFWQKFAELENSKSMRLIRMAEWFDQHSGLMLICVGAGMAIGLVMAHFVK